MPKRLILFNDAKRVAGGWVMTFDGNPKTVDFGLFYPYRTILGSCFYERYLKIGTGFASSNGHYDWSDGYGGAHAMLCSASNGNFTLGNAINGATNASPIVISTTEPHPYQTADTVDITGVLGNTAANGHFTVTRVDANHLSLNGSTGNGAYTSGGILTGDPVGRGAISFGADEWPYENQWAHLAVGIDMDANTRCVMMYYDGVPVGRVEFVGNRTCTQQYIVGQTAYMGGSDHSNFAGSIWQYCVWENRNPRGAIVGITDDVNRTTFVPPMSLGSSNGFADPNTALLIDFSQREPIVSDKSSGFPSGTRHHGQPKGLIGGVASGQMISGAAPLYEIDSTLPDFDNPTQPAGKTYTPASVPIGALAFDSIQRKNSTYTWRGLGGCGSTEGGTLGSLAWVDGSSGASGLGSGFKSFGILNEQFVFLNPSGVTGLKVFSRVPIGQANMDIRVDRRTSDTYGTGVSTSILFRYVDDNNFCFAWTKGTTRTGQSLFVGQVVAGTITNWASSVACPATSWVTLKVKTKSSGVYEVWCDATMVTSGTQAANASGTGAGICVIGSDSYGQGSNARALQYRWRNFTVFDNP